MPEGPYTLDGAKPATFQAPEQLWYMICPRLRVLGAVAALASDLGLLTTLTYYHWDLLTGTDVTQSD